MKKFLAGVLFITSLNVFAEDAGMDEIIKCGSKVEKVIFKLAELEIGKDFLVTYGRQKGIATQSTFIIKVKKQLNTESDPEKTLTYEVKTVDKSESDLCQISSIIVK